MNHKKNRPIKLSSSYYMYGKHATLAAVENQERVIEKVYCLDTHFNDYKNSVIKHSYEIVTPDYFNKILPKDAAHQGIAAKLKSVFKSDINDLDLSKADCKIVILDQVTGVQNIGAIIRSAVAFGIDGMIVPYDNSPEENAALAKAASGALELITLARVVNLRKAMQDLKEQGFWIIGLDADTEEYIAPSLFKGKAAIVVGSEGKGMRRLTKDTCDHIVKIPISKNSESLNVSNAAAIAFYIACNECSK